jgi:hypothetical protein
MVSGDKMMVAFSGVCSKTRLKPESLTRLMDSLVGTQSKENRLEE